MAANHHHWEWVAGPEEQFPDTLLIDGVTYELDATIIGLEWNEDHTEIIGVSISLRRKGREVEEEKSDGPA